MLKLILFVFLRNKAASILDESDLNAYILMDRIKPVEHYNFLLKQFKTIERLKVTTELGLFGLTIRYKKMVKFKMIL